MTQHTRFKINDHVVVHGLARCHHYNGAHGVIKQIGVSDGAVSYYIQCNTGDMYLRVPEEHVMACPPLPTAVLDGMFFAWQMWQRYGPVGI